MGSERIFTEHEKKFILDNYPGMSIHALKKQLGCSWYAVHRVVEKAGVFSTSNVAWSKEQEDELRVLAEKYSLNDIIKILGRTRNSVYLKARKIGVSFIGRRSWTEEEENDLKEMWGNLKIEAIAKRLRRSVYAIKVRVQRLGIVPMLDNSGVVGLSQLSEILGVSRSRISSWRKKGLVVKRLAVSNNKRYLHVSVDDLKAFLKENPFEYDSSLIDYNLFRVDPDWYKRKRERDKKGEGDLHYFVKYRFWTEKEKGILKKGLLEDGLSYEELAVKLGRTANAVKYKAYDLGLGYRLPRYWKGHQIKFLMGNYKTMKHCEMADILGRSEKAVAEKCRQLGLNKRKV